MKKTDTKSRVTVYARNRLQKKLQVAAILLITGFFTNVANAQLSGNFTIGKTGDFKTFTDAVDSLAQVGVSGPVEFKVSAGTFNEQVKIPYISGASSGNTITFKGAGKGTGGTLLTFDVNNFYTSVLEVNSATNIIFKDLHIKQTNCTEGRFTVGLIYASEIVFDNCHIEAPRASACSNLPNIWGLEALHIEGSSFNTFTNNRFNGGSLTINAGYWGSGYDVYSDNKIVGGTYNTIQFYDGQNLEFVHNEIDSADYSDNLALSADYCSGIKVAYNSILGHNNASGMNFTQNNISNNTTPGQVYNNFINLRSSNMRIGIGVFYYAWSPAQVDFIVAHNTINVVNAPRGEALSVENENVTGVQVLNNSITRRKGGIAMSFLYPQAEDAISGNNFYNGNTGDLVQYGRSAYTNIADYKTAAAALGHGLYDQSMDVIFKGARDLHLDQSTKAPWGPITFITDDIDGETRCKSFVTAGADESFYKNNDHYAQPGMPSFTEPAEVYHKNPVVFENDAKAGKAEKYSWYINNRWITDSMHLATVLEGPNDTVKLVAYNCGGMDSFISVVQVKTPTSVPVTDFISNKSNIIQGETVKLFDISTNYPSAWLWEITPKQVFKGDEMKPAYEFVYGDETSQNIQVRFLQGGNYKVCYTASNIVGSGNTECVTSYIEVTPSVNLGSGTVKVSDLSGYIFDNGGRDKPYRYAEPYQDRLVIGECADSVYLVFKSFDLNCGQFDGDFLRIYEGTNNRGRALHCTSNTTPWGYGPGLTGNAASSCLNACSPITLTGTDTFKAKGSMYIEMSANTDRSFAGFEAYYWVKPKKQTAPVAKFVSADSVCINSPIAFSNESTGDDMKFLWDPDADGEYEALGKNISYMYFMDGKFTISMIAFNCGGSDTFSKEISVYLPQAPIAQFMADNTTPTTDDVVFLTANVPQCVDDYTWKFTPASGKGEAIFVNGSSERSPNPNVRFTDTGCYSVTLYVLNSNGEDEVKVNCFIRVREPYCKPAVKTLIQDVGISEVQFGSFSSQSAQGESAFTDYTNNASKAIHAELGVSYTVNVKRNTNKHKVTRTIWIDWNYDGEFDNVTEKVAEEVNSTAKDWNTSISIPLNATTGATVMRVAVNQGTYTNKACGRNEFGEYEDYRLYIRPDMTKPVITLIGDTTITFEQGTNYVDAGATANDNLDGDLTASIVVTEPVSGFNTIPGTYYYRYNVKDVADNQAKEVIRKIIVVADFTAPKLIVAGGDTLETILYSAAAYTPPAVLQADDLVDGDLSGIVKIDNPVNMNVVDTYLVTYTVTDVSKNTATVVKTVIVKDTVKPVITVYGDNPYYHNVSDIYVDWGVTMTDNYYPVNTLNDALITTNNLNVNVPGTYEYVYTVKDGSGNLATTKRIVIVGDMVPPVVSIIGDTIVVVEVNTRYQDPGFNATDNYTTNIIKQTLGSFYSNFPNGIPTQLDTFHIVYTATDMGNNSVSKTRYIVVKDQTEPVISLKGTPNATVCRWEAYADAGYDVADNYYTNADITVTTEGDWTANSSGIEGPYSLRYKAVDKSGNIGYSEWRTIWVRSPYEFPCATNVSIGDANALEKAISIFPNPNSGKFSVQAALPGAEKLKLTVTNMLGQEVAVITDGLMNNAAFQVDLSSQPAGVYLLNVSTANHTATKRIVISK